MKVRNSEALRHRGAISSRRNLGVYWHEHDAQGAIYWLREAVRRNPADAALTIALWIDPADAEAKALLDSLK